MIPSPVWVVLCGWCCVGGALVQRFWAHIPDRHKELTFPANHHHDIRTGEAVYRSRPWAIAETTTTAGRGARPAG